MVAGDTSGTHAHRRLHTLAALILTLGASAGAASAQTVWYVDVTACPSVGTGTEFDPFCLIQSAIDAAAASGDEIRVAPGTYHEAIDFLGKGIHLHSTHGRDVTTIDATGLNTSVVTCATGEGADAILEGLTITGGNGTLCSTDLDLHCGGGVYIRGADPTITGCGFVDNAVGGNGGGLYVSNGDPVISECAFRGNSANSGGAVYTVSGAPELTFCRFTGNTAQTGGGVHSGSARPTITHCAFIGNSAETSGGGLNSTNAQGVIVVNCIFTGNSAAFGGALYDWASSPAPVVVSSTLTANTATGRGGGVFANAVTVLNSILWGNSDWSGRYESAQLDGSGRAVTLEYSCVEGLDMFRGNGNIEGPPLFADVYGADGLAGTEDDDLHLLLGSPCIDAGDNRTVPVDTLDMDGDGDTLELMPVDLDGAARFSDNACVPDVGAPHPDFPTLHIVDMGAFELADDPTGDPDGDSIVNCDDNCPTHPNPAQEDCDHDGRGDACAVATCHDDLACADCNGNAIPDACDIADKHSIDADLNGRPDECQHVFFVDDDASPGGDGASWSSAFTDLQQALAAVRAGDEILVAAGVYRPDAPGGDRTATFRLVNGVQLKGGYAGLGNTDQPDARDPVIFESTLCGDLDGDDGFDFVNNTENSYHVVASREVDTTTTLDGFTIRRGNANGDKYHDVGAGMWNHGGSPTVFRCKFTENDADTAGGMYNEESDVTLTGNVFVGNAANVAAGMFNYLSIPTITACTFRRNTAAFVGGMLNSDSSPTLRGCIFEENSGEYTGALENSDSVALVIGCDFWENQATVQGGAMTNWGGDVQIVNSRFGGNFAAEYGGAMIIVDALVHVVDSTFSGNIAGTTGGAIDGSYASDTNLTNCVLTNNRAPFGGGVYAGSNTALAIASCVFWGNSGGELFGESEQISTSSSTDVEIVNTCVQGLDTFAGAGNIDADPLFHDAAGADDMAGTEDDDLRLQAGSPCINAGDPAFVPQPGESDLDGHPRVLCGRVDMGAYEFGIGDYDCDSNVNLGDFAQWSACLTAPNGGPIATGCEAFDFDNDRDVDLDDYAGFQQLFAGI